MDGVKNFVNEDFKELKLFNSSDIPMDISDFDIDMDVEVVADSSTSQQPNSDNLEALTEALKRLNLTATATYCCSLCFSLCHKIDNCFLVRIHGTMDRWMAANCEAELLLTDQELASAEWDSNLINDLINTLQELNCKATKADYVCHLCGQRGHQIKYCSLARPKSERLTPYQGTKRCYGEFVCPKCYRYWNSTNTWTNKTQLCSKCKTPTYPHVQKALSCRQFDPNPPNSPRIHRQYLCEKCIEMGEICSKTCFVPPSNSF